MPDLVFVRANRALPVKEGNAVIFIGAAMGSGAINEVSRADVPVPSGQSSFAQTVLATRFRSYGYYVGQTGYPPDAAGPTF
jgi:hypothetical protein